MAASSTLQHLQVAPQADDNEELVITVLRDLWVNIARCEAEIRTRAALVFTFPVNLTKVL